jgi:hypothetical protein
VGTVTEWADYEDALDGNSVFVTKFDVWINKERREFGNTSSKPTQAAIVEGSEYLWLSTAVNASLLWRTHEDYRTVKGFSGSVLCLGHPSDKTVKAIVFQNYELPIKSWQVKGGDRELTGDYGWRIKAGFFLPEEIRESEIYHEEPEVVKTFQTVPTRKRDSESSRRSFSSHQ